eukprot:2336007-Alexandrium_andersonii.AAC.1
MKALIAFFGYLAPLLEVPDNSDKINHFASCRAYSLASVVHVLDSSPLWLSAANAQAASDS